MILRYKLHEFVYEKHKGQVRKYTGEPYYYHVLNVAEAAEASTAVYGYEIGLCHDLLEDTECTQEELYHALVSFGYGLASALHISNCVKELTDVFTHKNYPQFKRAERKTREAQRLWAISTDSQTVKYCDLIDNSSSIVDNDPSFAKVYIAEKEYILAGMMAGDSQLLSMCRMALLLAKDKLANL